MKRFILMSAVAVLVLFGWMGISSAQGVQSGTIRGVVKDQQDLPVPGVAVTATSRALQGSRRGATDERGLYALSGLPVGTYEIKFELTGFATVTRSTPLPLGLTVEESVTLRTGAVTETVQVVAEVKIPSPLATPVIGANFKHEEIEALPSLRTLDGIARLAPGVDEATPNVGQVKINGAFAFDNVFLLNGVDIQDNLFATPYNLFVEDAIEETQVLTSGISAEYGRFTGGVINAVTKSGSNHFSGSGRINFLNPDWTTRTPFEETKGTKHIDILSRTYEVTFGGPVVPDRLWFFTSGRYAKTSNQVTLQQTGAGLTSLDTNKRGEIKVTGTPVIGHTIQGGFFNDPRTRTNNSGLQSFVIVPDSEEIGRAHV